MKLVYAKLNQIIMNLCYITEKKPKDSDVKISSDKKFYTVNDSESKLRYRMRISRETVYLSDTFSVEEISKVSKLTQDSLNRLKNITKTRQENISTALIAMRDMYYNAQDDTRGLIYPMMQKFDVDRHISDVSILLSKLEDELREKVCKNIRYWLERKKQDAGLFKKWIKDYNNVAPHSGPDMKSPLEYRKSVGLVEMGVTTKDCRYN